MKKYLLFIIIFLIPNQGLAQLCSTSNECVQACNMTGQGVGIPASSCIPFCMARPATCERSYFFCSYNTFASDFVWLEIVSKSNSTIDGGLFVFNSEGSRIDPFGGGFGSLTDLTFSLNSLGRFDFPVHDNVSNNSFGQVLVVINGLNQNQISAGVSFYQTDGLGSLDQKVHIPCTQGDASLIDGIIP